MVSWRRGDAAIVGDVDPHSRRRLGVFPGAAAPSAPIVLWRCDCGAGPSNTAQVSELDALLSATVAS